MIPRFRTKLFGAILISTVSDSRNGWSRILIESNGSEDGGLRSLLYCEPGDSKPSGRYEFVSKNFAVLQYWISFGFEGIQYITTSFVDVMKGSYV